MSESDLEPSSDYRKLTVSDEELPEDLKPGEDNLLADPGGVADDFDPDLGDPHIESLGSDADEPPEDADTDASEHAHHGQDSDADAPGES